MRATCARPRVNRIGWVVALFVIYACGDSGGGCGGCDDDGSGEGGASYVYPADAPIFHQGLQVHVNQSAFDFIGDNAGDIIGDLIGDDGLSFCLEEQTVELLGFNAVRLCNRQTCSDGSTGCQLDIDINSLRIIPQTRPASDRLRIEILLGLDETLNFDLAGFQRCRARLRSPAAGLPVAAHVYFDVADPPGERTSVRLPGDELEFNVSDINLNVSGERAIIDALCSGVNLLSGTVVGLLEDEVAGPIEDALGPLLCTDCDVTEDCPSGSTCNGDGLCIIDGTSDCVPLALGVELEVNLGELLADLAGDLEAKLGVLLYLANYADAIGPTPSPYVGLDLAGQLGFDATPNACVPYRDPPSLARYPKSPELNAERTPGGDEFMLGIGIARRAINFALWGVYNSGVLCLSIGTDTVEQLTTLTLGALVPSLSTLTDGSNRPMYITLRPQQPPTVDLGLGTIAYDPDGTPRVVDPLLTLNLHELEIDFYAFVEQRYVRVFTLDTDVEVPLGLDVTMDNEIVVLLPDDLTDAIARVEAINGELLAESDLDRVATLLPTLLGTLLPSLTDGLIDPIEIPEIEGFVIELPPGAFTSVDSLQMLAIFANLELASSAKFAPGPLMRPEILDVRAYGADAIDIERMVRRMNSTTPVDLRDVAPLVEIDLEAIGAPVGADIEYSYRVSGGAWSFWYRGDTLRLRNPVFALQGHHHVEIRARQYDNPYSESPIRTWTVVTVDYEGPAVRLERDGMTVRVHTTDLISPHNELRWSYRINGGAWQETYEVLNMIDVSAYEGGNALVEVVAIDQAGNQGTARRSFNLERSTSSAPLMRDTVVAGGVVPGGDSPQAGCSFVSSPRSAWFGILVVFAAMFWHRRRPVRTSARTSRRSDHGIGRRLDWRAAIAVALAAFMFSACGDKKSAGGGQVIVPDCDPACEEGLLCIDGACVTCGSADDCPAALPRCEAGQCIPELGDTCLTGEPCADGFICDESGVCVVDNSCTSDGDCPDGQLCEGNQCVAAECSSPGDCAGCSEPDSPICVSGRCACEPPCVEGCATGTACCFASNSCVEVSAACAARDCPIGTRLEAISDPVFDSATCASETECDCVELPPLPIGFIGRHLDVAVSPDGDTRLIAAYNATYGDLMVGVVSDLDAVTWTFVDGAPTTGEVTGNLNGPRGGIAVAGENVGRYPSIAIAPDRVIHIAYRSDATETPNVRYARGAGDVDKADWVFINLDDTAGSGEFTNLLLDSESRPVIVYRAPAVHLVDDGVWASEIRLIQGLTATPESESDFAEPVVIERQISGLPCGGTCRGRFECRADEGVCAVPERGSACSPECTSSQSCFRVEEGRACVETTRAPSVRSIDSGMGLFLDVEWLDDGRIALAHYDRDFGNLRYVEFDLESGEASGHAILDGEIEDEEGERVDTGDVGWSPDLFVDESGNILVSYVDGTRGQLRVYDRDAGTISLVDDGARCFAFVDSNCTDVLTSRVGDDSALYIDGDDVLVVYQDATQHHLMESPRGEFGWEVPLTIAGGEPTYDGAFGFYIRQSTWSGGRFIATYRMNNREEPPSRDVVVLSP